MALAEAIVNNRAFGAYEMAAIHKKLDKAAKVQNKGIIALVRSIEALLRASK